MRRLLVLLAIALFAVACSGGDTELAQLDADPLGEVDDAVAPGEGDETADAEEAPETTVATTTTTEAAMAEFEYLPRGTYQVGVSTLTVDEGTDRPLTVDVWFPLAEGTSGDAKQYTLLPGVYYESPEAVVADLGSIANEQFPLVVYSHGSGGQRWIHSDYTEFMASHGYIVVAPDHTGNTLIERFAETELDVEQVAFNRVSDVKSVLDAATGADANEPLGVSLGGALTDDVIVTGHSFGGYTSYAIVSGVDDGLGAIEADDRVDAVITLAPATGGLSDDQLASVDVPHLVMVGDSDDTTPIDPNVERAWEHITGSPGYRVELADAEHQTFTDLCDYREFMPQLESVPEFVIEAIDSFAATDCAATAMPLDRAQDITNTFAVRFLDEITRGGASLADDEVTYGDDVLFLSK